MINIGDEAGMGLALNWVQHAIITAYENNCPFNWLNQPGALRG
jgi:hypothetical protein